MLDIYFSINDFGIIGEVVGYLNGLLVEFYFMLVVFGVGDWVSMIGDMEKWGDVWMGDLFIGLEQVVVFFVFV